MRRLFVKSPKIIKLSSKKSEFHLLYHRGKISDTGIRSIKTREFILSLKMNNTILPRGDSPCQYTMVNMVPKPSKYTIYLLFGDIFTPRSNS